MLCDENKPHPLQSVARHPPKNACGFLFAANASSPAPVRRLLPFALSLIFPSAPWGIYRPSRRCHGFCNAWASTLPPQSWSVMPPNRVVVLVPAANTLFVDNTAQPARRPASTSTSHWARVAAVAGIIYFSFGHCSAATHAQCGHMSFEKSLLLWKSYERPSRLTHTLRHQLGKKTTPAAASTSRFKL